MNVLTSILLICAAGMTLAWLVAAQRRLAARLARRFLALPRLQQVALVLAVGVMTVSAQKQDREIIELSNNRIIESAEASASGSAAGGGTPALPTTLPLVGLASRASRDDTVSASPSLLNLRVNKNISAQIELFPNGDFITRSNEVEWVYRRINPDDWDDDGIANEGDDEPMITADETQFGPQQTLPDGANSNAYCWVDLVVPQANAKVTFAGDGASNLADPSFIAKAGEAHRVAILIGKTYRVTCPLPFHIAAKSSDEIDETWNGANEVELCWPVSVNSCVTDDDAESDAQRAAIRQIQVVDASNYTLSPLLTLAATADANATTTTTRTQSFVMSVVPSGLGGLFNWTKHCCSISGTSYAFEQTCRGKCDCSDCSTEGYFEYEGYRLPVYGPSCPCSGEPVDDAGAGDDDEPPSRGVSAYFTKSVIFFEDEYDNSPTEHVGWRSTETVLKCSANGGEKGGLVRIEIEGADGLVQYNGESLPYMKSLEPNETISFKNAYRAVEESKAAGDIKIKATFAERETAWSQETTDEATAVMVEIEPVVSRDGALNRHMMGIGEIFHVWTFPDLSGVELRMSEGWGRPLNGDEKSVACPLNAARDGVQIVVEANSYAPSLNVVVPSSIVCRGGVVIDQGLGAGVAGGIGMLLEPYVQPEGVAFSRVKMMEIPTLVGAVPATGYFANERYAEVWAHTQANGAGVWHRPGTDNFFFRDLAAFGEDCPQPWSVGRIAWDIPIGWADLEAESSAEILQEISVPYNQVFTIDSAGGVKVEKFGRWVKRMPTGEITCSDGIVNLQEE